MTFALNYLASDEKTHIIFIFFPVGYCWFSVQISKGSTAAIWKFQCHHSRYIVFIACANVIPNPEHGREFVTI